MRCWCVEPRDLFDPRCWDCNRLSTQRACHHFLQRAQYEKVFAERPVSTVVVVSYTPMYKASKTFVIYNSRRCRSCLEGRTNCGHAFRRRLFEEDVQCMLRHLWFYPIAFPAFIGVSRSLLEDPGLRARYQERESAPVQLMTGRRWI